MQKGLHAPVIEEFNIFITDVLECIDADGLHASEIAGLSTFISDI
jgi:hypothetical protein